MRMPAGKHETHTIPDTLDLTDHAQLAIHGVIGNLDPDVGYDMWFHCEMAHKTPFMKHPSCDNACTPKYGKLLPMMRLMSGSDEGLDIEAQMRNRLCALIEEGIYWNKAEPHRPWRCMYNWDKADHNPKNEDLASPVGNARMMHTLMTWAETENTSQYDDLIREMIEGHERMLVTRQRKDGSRYSYFPDAGYGEAFSYPRNSGWLHEREPMTDTEGMEGSVTCYHGHSAYFLSKWYHRTGDERALDMARRIVNYNIQPHMWGGVALHDSELEQVSTTAVSKSAPNIPPSIPSPTGVDGGRKGHWFMHFHGRAVGMRGILEYGIVTGDQRALEFANNTWAYSRSHMMDRIGWIDGAPAKGGYCEGCNLADFMGMAIRLSDAGVGDYWDDVDACMRNALIEQQFYDLEAGKHVLTDIGEDPEGMLDGLPGQFCTEDVLNRLHGVYFAGSNPVAASLTSIGCCTGNGPMGFYYAWEAALREDANIVTANLLINRVGHAAEIRSWLPYEGKVEIHMKAARKLAVRLPRWVSKSRVECHVSLVQSAGQTTHPVTPEIVGNYATFDALQPGDIITLEFPVFNDTVTYTWNKRVPDQERDVTFEMRGSTCVGIKDRWDMGPGWIPNYRREHMKAEMTPMVEKSFHIPERIYQLW